jgi:hypothetical protein
VELDYIMEGQVADYRVEMFNKPIQHTALQMITIRDMGETRCPENGEGFTDDIMRALVLLVAKIHTPKIMERLVEAKDWVKGQQGPGSMPMPVYVSRGRTGFRMGLS